MLIQATVYFFPAFLTFLNHFFTAFLTLQSTMEAPFLLLEEQVHAGTAHPVPSPIVQVEGSHLNKCSGSLHP
jgi:hypothetical protein